MVFKKGSIPWNAGLKGDEYLKHFKTGNIWSKGLTMETDERVKKIAEKQKGRSFSEEHKINIGLSQIGEHRSPKTEFKKGLTPHSVGKTKKNYEPLKRGGKNISKTKNSKEWKETNGLVFSKKMSAENKKRLKNTEYIRRISEGWFKNGQHKGKTFEERFGKEKAMEIRKKFSATMQGIPLEEWKSFTSLEPYGIEFNKKLKKFVRERDGCCMLCNVCFEDLRFLKRKVNVHHINYDKKCNLPNNLITLCNSCHGRTHINRKQWTRFFQSLLSEKYGYKYSNTGEIILKLNNPGGE
jgi:hypothetical protein